MSNLDSEEASEAEYVVLRSQLYDYVDGSLGRKR